MEREVMSKNTRVDLRYFDYLYRLISDPTPNDSNYYYLLKELHRNDFYSIVDFDENRAVDGIGLRDLFYDTDGEGYYLPHFTLTDRPCSVFEMMIGVAIRMEGILTGEPFEKTASECFWILVDNLGLAEFDDNNFHKGPAYHTIGEKITDLLERRYNFNGEGGLFPLNHPKKDQREVEIWYQMNEYLLQNYNF